MTSLLFVGIGLTAGVLGGMFGLAGGIVIVPSLMLLAKFTPQTATGTSLAALILPVGLLGAYAYYKEGAVRVTPALWIALGLFFGAYVGARISLTVSPVMLKRMFAVFLVVVAVRMWVGK